VIAMSDDLNDLFAQEMGDVKPLNKTAKVALKRDDSSTLAQQALRQSAQQELVKDQNHLSSDYVELLDPYFPLEYKRPGVQHGVFKKLKQGKYDMEARLDLHRMKMEQARKEVYDFIKQSMAYDLRTVIIIPGRGSHTPTAAGALLKSYVNKWLQELDEVQAFCSAQQHHGGVGAVYVLLRKSENKKQQNRDRIYKGRLHNT
jgi:DNA-nicking Smr family endonuclease